MFEKLRVKALEKKGLEDLADIEVTEPPAGWAPIEVEPSDEDINDKDVDADG